ncbi:MAG: hypothetical protein V3V06_07220, partial [Dehalococcoidia bacterium]
MPPQRRSVLPPAPPRGRWIRSRPVRVLLVVIALVALMLGLELTSPAQAAPSPVLTGAFADNNGGAAGVQAGDRVTLIFDSSTNALAITAANIDTALQLANGHTWLDGAGAIGGAVWTTTTSANDTLVVTLSDG